MQFFCDPGREKLPNVQDTLSLKTVKFQLFNPAGCAKSGSIYLRKFGGAQEILLLKGGAWRKKVGKHWFKRFKNGRESFEPRSGRPCTSRNEVKNQVREEVLNDRHVTVREIAVEVGISTGSVNFILTEDLRMRRVSAEFVPKLLMEEQKGASERKLQGHAGLREP